MKKQLITIAFGALLASGSALALASPSAQDYQDQHGQGDQQSHNDHRDHDEHNDHRDHDEHNDHRDHNEHRDHNDRRAYVEHDRGRHEGWYRRGGHMPPQYRGSRYVVTDWRARHLRQPPPGYHWVRSDNGDFLLVAVTTGIIASIIANAITNGH